MLTNGGNQTFVGPVTNRVFEALLGLEREAIPGSPAGVPQSLRPEWNRFTERVVGRYVVEDAGPPGVLGWLMGKLARPAVSHVADGILSVERLVKGETIFLHPDGDVGHYRIAWPLVVGARTVIAERDDGAHLWISILHLRKGQ